MKWEYRYLEFNFHFDQPPFLPKIGQMKERRDTLNWLNDIGKEEWELCSSLNREKIRGGFLIRGLFKRKFPNRRQKNRSHE